MQSDSLLRELQGEIQKHALSTFVDDPPAIGQGGKGGVVTGCPHCRKQFGTVSQLVSHVTDDVLPEFFRRNETRSLERPSHSAPIIPNGGR